MSIAGAVGVGLVAGAFVLHYKKEHYDEKINKLQGYATKLDEHLEVLKGLKQELYSFWQDGSGENYAKTLDKQINQLRIARERVEDLSNLYDEISGKLGAIENKAKAGVDTIASIVSGLSE